ncbi:MAG: GNAT family N-acetyltransferase [Lachnospiraceae bacterium]|nr:GNAT family N-acetyltransferase [Lachnospiraceae bacterium]
MEYQIRKIEKKDNSRIEQIIRACLVEFGGDHEGCAWTDPDLGRFSEIYQGPGCSYWVAVRGNGEVVGGVGIGPLTGVPKTCELQKMYCIPEVRGSGVAKLLMETALTYAAQYYQRCYLETFANMVAAHKLYEKYGFKRIDHALGNTAHFTCDVRYLKEW